MKPNEHTETTVKTALGFFPIKKFHAFHKDANINYQLNRFLIPGLEDVFARIGRHTENYDDWKEQFLTEASSFEKEGNPGHAMGLYRAAEFFMNPADPDRMGSIEKFLELFHQSEKGKNIQQISVPYGNSSLHGFRLTPTVISKGTILIHGGFDSYVEEFYTLGELMCENGYDVVMFDGPGQGSTLMFGKVPMTHEWEKPITAVLDYLGADNVTLIGISLGGYLAIRAAALEKRIQRVIAYDVMLDFFACITSRRGRAIELFIRGLVRLKRSSILNAAARVLMKKDQYAQWGITQGMHVMGCKTPYEFFVKLKAHNGYATSGLVTGDVLAMAGAEDHFVPLAQFFEQLKLLISARSVTGRIFTGREQAQSHCQVGNLGVAALHMLGWINEHSLNSNDEKATQSDRGLRR